MAAVQGQVLRSFRNEKVHIGHFYLYTFSIFFSPGHHSQNNKTKKEARAGQCGVFLGYIALGKYPLVYLMYGNRVIHIRKLEEVPMKADQSSSPPKE